VYGVAPFDEGEILTCTELGSTAVNRFIATVTACDTETVSVNVNSYTGSGSISAWHIGRYTQITTSTSGLVLNLNGTGTLVFEEPLAGVIPYAVGDVIKAYNDTDTLKYVRGLITASSSTSITITILQISPSMGGSYSGWSIGPMHPKTKYTNRNRTWFIAKLTNQRLTASAIGAEFTFPGLFQLNSDYYGLTNQLSQSAPKIKFSDFYGVTNDYFPFEIDSTSTTQSPSQFIVGPVSSFTLLQSGWIKGNTIPTPQQSAYTNCVGAALIDTIELRIGGQLIETLTGEYIQTYMDLTTTLENKPALTILYGKDDTSSIYTQRQYLVNIPFYFHRETGLAIPLCALYRQDVEIAIKFNYIGDKFTDTRAINIQPFVSSEIPLNATIIAEYAYLTGSEIDFFKKKRLTYLISQVQISRQILPVASVGGFFQLQFINPVVELQMLIRNNRNIDLAQLNQGQVVDYFDYANNGLKSMALFFNGQEAFNSTATDHIYLGALEILDKHTGPAFSKGTPSANVFSYSFSLKPESISNPSGHVNMSRIRQQVLEINLTPDEEYEKQLTIYAINYNILRVEYGLGGLLFNSSQ
jgi:hypothetical protein